MSISAASLTTRGNVRYHSWGETFSQTGAATPTTFRYTGQRVEAELGIYYYNARWVDPLLGRFLQADSIVPDPYNPLDFDRFAYCRNNPLRYSDPSGHFSEDEIDKYLQSIGITNADERAKIIAQWKDDDEWWKVIGPGGATYGDVLDGAKLFLGRPYGERVVLKFTKNEKAGTFGIQGNAILWDIGGAGAMSVEKLSSDYSLVKFHHETSDIIWMRPNANGELTYQGGTGFGGDGANVQWNELGHTIGMSAAAFGTGLGAAGLMVIPGGQAFGVMAFTGFGYELTLIWDYGSNFNRSWDATNRLRLDLGDSTFIP